MWVEAHVDKLLRKLRVTLGDLKSGFPQEHELHDLTIMTT